AEWGLQELVLSSFEAASASGRYGVEELRAQLAAVASAQSAGAELGRHPGDIRRAVADALGQASPWSPRRAGAGQQAPGADGARGGGPAGTGAAHGTPVALNVVPFTGALGEGGWTSRELTVRDATRKVLGRPGLPVVATCV